MLIATDKVKAFFFKAMLQGWVNGSEEFKIPDLPGYKAIAFRDGDLYLLDRYCVNLETNMSAGTTTIWFKDSPIWVMNYGGWYSKDALKLVKKALAQAYEQELFLGGRGVDISLDGLVYKNVVADPPHLKGREQFWLFYGEEEVRNPEGNACYGWHIFSGMSLQ
ncbi:MAG: hypothetical protein HY226_05155 [Candidatus Vogelbacteria bacterium]|nr:hypothetical protein [Candidatus Vogelbacteria bacterium]